MLSKVAACVALTAFGGVWASPEDHDATRAKAVEEINAIPGLTWKAGINPNFKGKPLGSSKELCGVKPGHADLIRKMVKDGEMDVIGADKFANVEAPTSFDSAEHWTQCKEVLTDIRDQSNCGCCWAFSSAGAMSDRLCIGTNAKAQVALSTQELCFCSESDGCDGGFPAEALRWAGSNGLVTGAQYNNTGPFGKDGLCIPFSLPHCHHHGPQGSDPYPAEGKPGCPKVEKSPECPTKCAASAKTPYDDFKLGRYIFTGRVAQVSSDADIIAKEIMTNGPVSVAYQVYDDFENYVSGIYKRTSSVMLGGHAVKMVGWGEENGVKYWKVANSWNPYWGEKGYFRIVRGTNECGIEDEVVAPVATKWTGPGLVDIQVIV